MLREPIDRADKLSGHIGDSALVASSASSNEGIELDLKPADADPRARELRHQVAGDKSNSWSKSRLSPFPPTEIGVFMSEFGSASEPQMPSVGSDRRAEERRPVNITAAVLSPCRQKFTTANIVDRSESGAKIKLDKNISLPKVILLVDFENGPVFGCEVRWRQDYYLGVRIIDVYGPVRRRSFFETSQLRNCAGFADPPPVR